MTPNPSGRPSRPEPGKSGVCGGDCLISITGLAERPGRERLRTLLCELDQGDWSEEIAAMIKEDYRQLMDDFFGFR